ncbi:MAG: helix-turn-helix domain-containing protein [Pseudomonadota bacterium]
MASRLSQDPHQRRDGASRVLEEAIGRQVRALRQQSGTGLAELAALAGLSGGMLSKIENGQISPSLATLQALSSALHVPITAFFQRFEETRRAVHVKAGEGLEVERVGTRAGHQYSLLGHLAGSAAGVVTEPYMITLSDDSDVFPTFQHDGVELLFMLEGEVGYRHGETVYRLCPGDALFFEADAPHGPEALIRLPARFLSVISYAQPS